MAVWLSPELQPSDYWQEVQSLANELLDKSTPSLAVWTVRIRPMAAEEVANMAPGPDETAQELWHVEADFGGKELTVGVPHEWEAEEGDEVPEDAATYVVLDLLLGIMTRHGADDPGGVVQGDAVPGQEIPLDELLDRWRECRRALEEVRDPHAHTEPSNGTPSESALLEEIERLDAEIWWRGHDRGAG